MSRERETQQQESGNQLPADWSYKKSLNKSKGKKKNNPGRHY